MVEHGQNTRQLKWQVPFLSIWTGQQLSLVGSRAAQFALVWWLTQTTGSATVLATASLAALLPGIVIGPFAGALVDRWSRRLVMIVADGLIALTALWLAYLFWADALQIWHVYVVMFVRSVFEVFHWPAMQASTALMVPKRHLTRVAGLNMTVLGILNIAGAPLGALLMDLLPLHGVMLVDVGTAALAIAPLFFVAIPQPTDTAKAREGSLWSDVRSGLRYLWGWPGMIILIGAAMIFKFLLTPAFSLFPLLVSEHFQGDAAQLSLLQAVMGSGIVAGGLVLSAWGGFKRKIYTILVGVIVYGGSLVLLGLTPATMFGLAVACMLPMGLMLPMIDGPLMAILQGTVAPEMQGRVFTVISSLLNVTGPLGLVIAGPVSDWLGLQVWFVGAGVLCAIIGTVGFFIPAGVNVEENCNNPLPCAAEASEAEAA